MVNKCIILGRLGKDPELRQTKTGEAVASLSVATSETYKDKSGQRHTTTEWHRVVVFGRTASNCAQFLAKGRQVYVEGRLSTNQWQDKDGKTNYSTEIIAHTVQFLDGGKTGVEKQNEREPVPAGSTAGGDDFDPWAA